MLSTIYAGPEAIFDGEPLGTFSDVLRCLDGTKVRALCADAQDSGKVLSEYIGEIVKNAYDGRSK